MAPAPAERALLRRFEGLGDGEDRSGSWRAEGQRHRRADPRSFVNTVGINEDLIRRYVGYQEEREKEEEAERQDFLF